MPKMPSDFIPKTLRFADLFCGIGGFHLAMQAACQKRGMTARCVFASDIDRDAQAVYQNNFGITPKGDLTQTSDEAVPAHDVLFAGFPCQAFSICGDRKGFDDARGTLFFEIARILAAKTPDAFVLENVKQLRGHDGGKTLAVILQTLAELGYFVSQRVLNALDFGLPQKRERIFLVGFRHPCPFAWPDAPRPMKPLSDVLESEVASFYHASPQICDARIQRREGKKAWDEPTIWHENKGGEISAYPWSCALRAGASYNYLLVDGKRRLTERELLRLQGFPDTFNLNCGYGAARRLTGNSVAVPCVEAVIGSVLDALNGVTKVDATETRIPQPKLFNPDFDESIP